MLAVSSQAQQYQSTLLSSLGGGWTRAIAVNSAGQIAGYSQLPIQGTVVHAVVWNDGQISDLGTLGGMESRAMDINRHGYTVGWALNSSEALRPVYWDDLGAIHELPTLGGRSGAVWAINDLGYAVGNAFLNNSIYHAALWSSSGVVDLGTLGGDYSIAYDINSSGVVVGGAHNAAGRQRACLWKDGRCIDLGSISGGSWDTVRGINDNGQMILSGIPADETTSHAVLWNGGVDDPVIDLGTFGGGESWAYGLNNQGQVVGRADPPSGIYQAFVYDGQGMTDLGTLGGMFSSAYGVNDDGIVVGYAQDAAGDWYAAQWTPVPEPSGLVAIIVGIGGLSPLLRRRRR
jgi:probable HAF family extracellular repeat protein